MANREITIPCRETSYGDDNQPGSNRDALIYLELTDKGIFLETDTPDKVIMTKDQAKLLVDSLNELLSELK